MPDRWLGVRVGSDAELTPRQRIASVAYAFRSAGDGDWTVDGDDMYSTVSGNIGIGTTDPQGQLHLSDRILVGHALASNPQVAISDEGDYAKIQGYNGDLSINPDGGSVGIKTTSPTHSLTVNWNIGIQQTGTTKYHIDYAGGGLNFVETGVADFRVFIEDGGNVGIGTGDPASELKVAGDAHVRGEITRRILPGPAIWPPPSPMPMSVSTEMSFRGLPMSPPAGTMTLSGMRSPSAGRVITTATMSPW